MSAVRLLVATSGLIVWSSAFVALYAGLSLGCEAGLQTRTLLGTNTLTVLLLAILALHLALLSGLQWYSVVLMRRGFQRTPEGESDVAQFLAGLTYWVTIVALVSTVVVGAPIVALSPCSRISVWL
jgi:hypothetical protein